MRLAAMIAVSAVFAAPLAAQERPEGWKVRLDRPNMTEADLEQFVTMSPGWHITTGRAAGIFYDPAWTATGTYTLSVKVHLFDPGQRHREAYGVFFGGKNLDGDDQQYSYFLLRDSGEFLIKKRMGTETSNVVSWTASDAVKRFGGEGSVPNVLEVRVGADSVAFYVNGTKATTLPKSAVDTDGTVGLRLNHALNLHVESVEVKPGR